MAGKINIKRDDLVAVVAGSAAAAGRSAKVLQVLPGRGRAIVEGVNFVSKTVRRSQDMPKGDIIRKEAPVALSNLMLYCPDCKRGVRIARFRDEKGRGGRKCRKCGHQF